MNAEQLLELIYRRRGVRKMIRRPTFAGGLRRKLSKRTTNRRRARKRMRRKLLGRGA